MNEFTTLDGARRCGQCSVCCWLCAVPKLDKPVHTPCRHLDPSGDFGKCSIYANRPGDCARYACSWLDGYFREDDRPDVSGVAFETSTLRSEGAGPDDPDNLTILTGFVVRPPTNGFEADEWRARVGRWAAEVARPGTVLVIVADDARWSRIFGTVDEVREVSKFFADVERYGVDDSLGVDPEGHPMLRVAR